MINGNASLHFLAAQPPNLEEARQAIECIVKDANRATYMEPLGPKGQAISSAIGKTPLRWILPFRHIPTNIFKAAYEGTPLAFADSAMRDNLLGKNGAVAQDIQWARLVVGSGIMGYVAHLVLGDNATGDGPTDPKARAEWMLTHQPNSVKVGDQWMSYNRLGPVGDLLGLGANLAEIAPHIEQAEYDKAAGHVVAAAGRWVTDATGMQGLAALFDAYKQPERKGPYFAQSFTSGFLPFSSGIRQTAAALDPHMRDAKGFIDGLKMAIPGEAWGYGRESLPVKRDWTGQPVANPMEMAIVRSRQVNRDPVNLEMQHLDIHPTLPPRIVKGVKLGPQMYDELQVLAGTPLRAQLEQYVNTPGWYQMNEEVRKETIEKTMKAVRTMAEGMLQLRHPQELIQAPLEAKVKKFQGVTPAQ